MARCLIFSLAYHPFVGGAEVAIREITDRIAPEEIEFHLITNRFDTSLPRTERVGNVTVHRVGFGTRGASVADSFSPLMYLGKIAFVPLAAYTAWQLNRRTPIDCCWAMMSYMLLPIVLLRLVGMRAPYALTLQEGDPFEHVFKRWYIRPVSGLLAHGFRHARVIHAISSHLASWALRAGYQGEVAVIPNGVEIAAFGEPLPAEERSALRARMGAEEDTTLLLTTSRLVHKNALDDVIRALCALPDSVVFVIYGEGPEKEALQALARELGVAERVRFMGQASREDLPKILAAADIFVRPSRSEGLGNSFIEAMAAEVPVIGTQEGGIREFLFDRVRDPEQPTTGWAVSVGSPAEIAAAVKDILAGRERTAQVIETARRFARTHYDWSRLVERMRTEVFQRLG